MGFVGLIILPGSSHDSSDRRNRQQLFSVCCGSLRDRRTLICIVYSQGLLLFPFANESGTLGFLWYTASQELLRELVRDPVRIVCLKPLVFSMLG